MTIPWSGVGRLLVTLGAGAALVVGAQADPRGLDLSRFAPAGAAQPDTGGQTADTVPVSAARTCVGPELLGLKGAPDQPQTVTVTAGRAPDAALLHAPTGAGRLVLTASGADRPLAETTALSVSGTIATASAVTVTATGALAPALAASQQWSADTKDLRGLAAVPCAVDADSLWLVAGGGDPGRQERLVLANPGANEVSVDLTVLGAKGIVASPNARGIIVPGRGRTSVLLDAVAAGEASPVVHVQVRGGTVAAVLSDLWLDGSVPAGADATGPTAAPAIRQVIAGMDLSQAGIVRVGVPGDAQAVVSVRVLTPNGGAPLPGGGVRSVPAGSTVDVPVADLPAGTYAVEVTSDVPVVAAGFALARDAAAVGDFAWTAATPALRGVAGLPLPALGDGGHRQLVLTSSGGAATATVLTGDPAAPTSREVTVPADRIVTLDLGPGAGGAWLVVPAGAAELRAAVLESVGTGATRTMAALPLSDTVTTVDVPRAFPQP